MRAHDDAADAVAVADAKARRGVATDDVCSRRGVDGELHRATILDESRYGLARRARRRGMSVARRPAAALALPRLGSVLDAAGATVKVPPLPALQWLAARGRPVAVRSGDWRTWLLSLCGPSAPTLRRFPAGPSLRALVGGRPVAGCWACAEPVHLMTALDHLRLAPRAELELPADEGRTLAASLDAALAGSGYGLRWSDRGAWLLDCASSVECDTVEPAQAEGRDVRDCLPSGRDGAAIRRLTNELQMLLHEHPVNTARAARGLPV